MNLKTQLSVSLLFVFFAFNGLAGNLLINGKFSENENGQPQHWKNASAENIDIAVNKEQVPEGQSQSLEVKVKEAGKGLGQVLQRIDGIKPNTDYFLQGKIFYKGKLRPFIQVKLLKTRKEIKRIAINGKGKGWIKVQKEFNSLGADGMDVICRFVQNKACIGQKTYFADLSLIPASERTYVKPEIRNMEAVATFSSIGVYVDVSGDVPKGTLAQLRYRKSGTEKWLPALPMVWGNATRQFRGSILNLAEAAKYDIDCQIINKKVVPNAPCTQKQISATTWNSNPPIAETRYLPAGISDKPLVINAKGKLDGWILYTRAKEAPSTIKVGLDVKNAVSIVDSQYVILRNISVRGGKEDAIIVTKSQNIRIQRCDIAEWSEAGTFGDHYKKKKNGHGMFGYYDADKKLLNRIAGVKIVGKDTSQIVVEDCFIHEPMGHANSWQFGHPAGPNAILISSTAGNHVIRNNDLVAREGHRFNDVIEGEYNKNINGGPYRDTDFYGNLLFCSNDDAVELDGGQMNVRFFNNWIESSYCGVSCAPNRRGPSYVYRNLIILEGEERGMTNFAFKMGGDKFEDPGVNFIYHNTVYSQAAGLRSGNYGKGPTPMVTRNNLFIAGDLRHKAKWLADFDYDLIPVGGLTPTNEEWEKHGITGEAKVVDLSTGNVSLAPGAQGVDHGCHLPTVNESFTGKGPDLGVFETGDSLVFPRRSSGMSAMPIRCTLKPEAKITLTVPASLGKTWQVHTDLPWLHSDPASGPCDGKPQTLTLSYVGKDVKPKFLQGAITFRTDEGYNRSVLVKKFVKHPEPVYLFSEMETLPFKEYTVVKDENASGGAYLQTPTEAVSENTTITYTFDVPKDDVYYLFAKVYMPGPDVGTRDSIWVSVDGGEKKRWNMTNNAPGVWKWSRACWFKEAYPAKLQLKTGKHTIVLSAREKVLRLDRILISNEPFFKGEK